MKDRKDLLLEAFVKSNRLGLMWGMPFGVALALFAADLVRVRLRRGVGAGRRADPGIRPDRRVQPHRLQLDRVLPRARGDEADRRASASSAWSAMLGIAVPLLLDRRARRARARDGDRHGDRARRPRLVPVAALPELPDPACTRRGPSRPSVPAAGAVLAAARADRPRPVAVARARGARALPGRHRRGDVGLRAAAPARGASATSAPRPAPRNLRALGPRGSKIASNPLWYHTLELAPGRRHAGLVRPAADRRPHAVARRARQALPRRRHLRRLPGVRAGAPRRGRGRRDRHRGPLALGLAGAHARARARTGWRRSRGSARGSASTSPRRRSGRPSSGVERSVYDLDPERDGRFDVVVCGSLLLHLRDPVRALEAIRGVCAG